jgi:nucleotide-binding universal stress UspA family protein
MKRILIALDYDPTAQKIAEKGFALAKSMQAHFTLLHELADPIYYSTSHVYFPMIGFSGYMDMDLQLDTLSSLKNTSQDFLDKTKKHLGDETIKTMVIGGDCADIILETAKTLQSDVIVMGSHSRRWLEDILMGSVTEKVLHQTTIPMFIIPTRKSN